MVRRRAFTVVAGVAAVLVSCALSVVGTDAPAVEAADSGAEAAAPDVAAEEAAAPDVAAESNTPACDRRVTQGLVVLYTFTRDAGETEVRDVSGVDPPLDLVVAEGRLDDDAGIVWQSGVIEFRSPGRLSSKSAATKIVEHAKSSNELTVEAWIVPRGRGPNIPARIVTMSRGQDKRNFTLGVTGDPGSVANDRWAMRTRTTNSNGVDNGGEVTTNSTVQLGKLTHVVSTRSKDGARAMFVDGIKEELPPLDGDFSNWNEQLHLHLANEEVAVDDDRSWLGSIHLVAIYARALTPEEVARNFDAGPCP
jgi:hypothetical protein